MIGHLKYLLRLCRSVLARSERDATVRARRTPVGLMAFALSLIALAAAADRQPLVATPSGTSAEVRDLRERTAFVYRHLGTLAQAGEQEIDPIEKVLLQHRDDPELARRIAIALVREGRQTGVDPRMLLAVLLVENPALEPKARSFVGAVGLMQVMPFHAGEWRPCAPDLEDVDANVCHGARIFAHYLGATNGDLDRALLRYNGCVKGTNTPDCGRYPTRVFARAGRASLWSWAATRASSAASR